MKTKIFILLFIPFVTSCNWGRICSRHFPPTIDTVIVIKDSVHIEYRDSLIPYALPPDTVEITHIDSIPITLPGPVIKTDTMIAENDFCIAYSWLTLYQRVMQRHLQLETKDTTLMFQLDSAVKESKYWHNQYTTITEKQKIIVKQHVKNRWIWFLVGLTVGLIIAFLVAIWAMK